MIGKIAPKNPEYNNPLYIDVPTKPIDKVLGAGGRTWQIDILGMFADSQFSALTAGCGSGKSTAGVALAIEDVLRSGRLQLFCVPQTHIADGFFKKDGVYTIIKIRDEVYSVSVDARHNFCSQSSLKRLKKLLLTDRTILAKQCDGNSLSGLFAMTSYHALAQVWGMMTPAQRSTAASNLHLRLDESHHLAMGDDEERDQNKIGAIVRTIMKSSDKSSRITLTTATSFRGDQVNIIPPALHDKFKYFKLDFLTHWKTLGIKDLDIEIKEFEGTPVTQLVRNISHEKNQKHYIAVPPSNAGWRKHTTDGGIPALITALQTKWPGVRILDLTKGDQQKSNKAKLIAEPKTAEEGESKFDVTIHQSLGREGTDWCPCSRLHVTYPEGSITLSVQTLGRLLRRFAGKTRAIARYYFPTFAEPKDGLTKDEVLDDRKNVLLMMTQYEEMFAPILFPPMPRNPGEETQQDHHMSDLESAIHSQRYRAMKIDFLNMAVEQGIVFGDEEGLDHVIEDIIANPKYHIPANLREAARDTLRVMYLRWTGVPEFRGVSIAFVREAGFGKLYAKLDAGDKTLVFKHGYKRMKELRKIVMKAWDAKFAEVSKSIKKPSDWDKPENRVFKGWALSVKAQKSKAKGASA